MIETTSLIINLRHNLKKCMKEVKAVQCPILENISLSMYILTCSIYEYLLTTCLAGNVTIIYTT